MAFVNRLSHLRRCFGRNVLALASVRIPNRAHTNILTSRSPKVNLIEDKSLPEIVFKKFEAFGNKMAIVDGITGQGYTFPQIQELTIKCASALTKHGFKKGDVFGIYCPNCPEFPIIYLAVLSLGGIVTTVSSLATIPEITGQFKDSKPKGIFTAPLLAPNAKKVAEICGIKEVFVVGEAKGCKPLSSLLSDDGKNFPKDISINPKEDLAAIPYSSGTTGLPKGVMLTHFNLTSNMQQYLDNSYHSRYTADGNILGLIPFFHAYGLNVTLAICLYSGSTIVTLPRFEEILFLETMQNFKISKAHITPPLALFLGKSPLVDNYNFPSLEMLLCGAAPVSGDAQKLVIERLKTKSLFTSNSIMHQGYGMTETSPIVLVTPVLSKKVDVAGDLVSLTEGKVVDLETGETLGVNQKGELCFRGPQVMKGYLNNPEATNETITADGWIRTGDIGFYDSDGFFSVVDRCKELIKYKGYQVAPAELEAILTAHPKIQDAGVIGVEDEECGELPKAFVLASGVSKEEIHSYINDLVAPYKKLRGGIEFVNEIPKSNTGKILRRLLKDTK